MNISELVDVFAGSGYNGRQLGNAARLYAKMIEEDATICLAVSGAMTPVGFGGIIKTLIERGFIDWIVTTGANVYHEDHFAWGLPVTQGSFDADDAKLYKDETVRIRDVYIKFYETLEAQDQVVQKMFGESFPDKPFTTAEFCNRMGRLSKRHAKHPEKRFIVTAYDYDVPVYISTLKDSSLALNLAIHRLRGKKYNLDFVREIIEQAAILYGSKKLGILELGGGVPKNTAQQTGPLLDQILRRSDGGQDYIIQITDARPDTGGLSGTPKITTQKKIILSMGKGSTASESEAMILVLLLNKIYKICNDLPVRIRKIIVIDEAWQMFKMKRTSKYIDMIVRMGRKMNIMFVFVSQRVDDIAADSGGIGKIIDNMATKIMLGLNEQAADDARDVLKLSEHERDYLTKFSAGQALFLADDYKVVTKFEPTEEEREMFDTTPTDE